MGYLMNAWTDGLVKRQIGEGWMDRWMEDGEGRVVRGGGGQACLILPVEIISKALEP